MHSESRRQRNHLLPQGVNGRIFDAVAPLVAKRVALAPYTERVAAAQRLATQLAPMLGAYYWLRGHHPPGSTRERALAGLLLMLHFRGVRFPCAVDLPGDDLPTPPAIVVCRHTQLNQLAVRVVAEAGLPVAVLASRALWEGRVMGGDTALTVVVAEGRLRLRRVATTAESGHVVFAAIDNHLPESGYTLDFSAGGRTLRISDQVPRLARSRGIPLWTCRMQWQGDRVAARFERMPDDAPVAQICSTLVAD